MATQKPTSTISYNTIPFLKEKLEDWLSYHWIQAYMFIWHKGEDGDKDHIHLRIVPNKRLDVMELSEILKEYDSDNKLPLGVRPWTFSKEEDWILYVLHDPEYMKIKYPNDKKEKLPYSWKDIVASEGFDVETAFIRAKASLKHNASNLVNRMVAGENPLAMIAEGYNPFMVGQLQKLITSSDYTRLLNDYNGVRDTLQKILDALNEVGLDVLQDEKKDKYYIARYKPTNVFDEREAEKFGLKTIRRTEKEDSSPLTKIIENGDDLPF